MASQNTEELKQKLIDDLNERVEDKIIEQVNADLLIKLIEKADTTNEAVSIAELGTTYKHTGFHFDKRLDKVQLTDEIKYLNKNEELSFSDDSNKPHHKLIIGDNYDALQNLLISHKKRIDVIYIDPPYGIDTMGQYAETNYNNAITRDNLLSMLYPRLILARELLSDEGVIFCSIDDRNQAYVKGVFDEVFSEKNFVGSLVWERKKKGSFLSDFIASIKEYILVYCKSSSQFKGLVGEINYTTETYPCINASNSRSKRTISKGIKSNYRKASFTVPEGTRISDNTMNIVYLTDLVVEDGVVVKDFEVEGNWRYSQELMNEYASKGELYITRSLYIRRIVSEPREKAMKDWLPRVVINENEESVNPNDLFSDGWGSNEDADNEMISIIGSQQAFSYPKPTKLLSKLFLSCQNKNATILDFFAGTGTTTQGALIANNIDGGERVTILCTNNEITEQNPNGIALDVTTKRLKRVMTGECYDGSKNFTWIEENEPYGGSLDVYDIESVANFEHAQGKTAFEVIDEGAYGESFDTLEEKIRWICKNFDRTQKSLGEE